MRKLKLYIATSLDGYIAGPDGELEWLEAGGGLDYGYDDFYESIDTTLMGNATYQVTLTVDTFPYPEKTNYVFTRSTPPDTDHVRFISGDIAGICARTQGCRRARTSGWLAAARSIRSCSTPASLTS